MEDYITFEARIEPVAWGRATYTVLRLPPEVSEALKAQGASRVEGEIAEHPVNLALSHAPVIEGTFLWTGQSLLDAAGLVPGEALEVRLRKADPTSVETPEDVAASLRAAGVMPAWNALTPGKQRGALYQIASAKRAATRAKRIAKLIETLAEEAP